MATKQKKRTASPRRGGPRRSSGSRKDRLPESRQSEAEPGVLEENERRVQRSEQDDLTVTEPVEEGAPVKAPEEDWGGGPSPNPPTA
jgi:hypothetical protein